MRRLSGIIDSAHADCSNSESLASAPQLVWRNILQDGFARKTRAWALQLEFLMGFITILNAVEIGISVDCNQDWPGWIAIDLGFAILFLTEMVATLVRGGCCSYWCGEAKYWNIYDFVLVCLAFVELIMAAVYMTIENTSTIRVIRVMRLVRVARIVRVCRMPFFNELMMMINGALGGIRTLLWSYFLLLLPLYVVALLLRQSLGEETEPGTGVESFSTLAGALFTSFRCLVAMDCTTSEGKPIFVLVAQAHGGGFAVLYCFTNVFMTFGLFNVIVAIYVENTVAAAKFNDTRQKQNRLTDRKMFTAKTLELMEFIWKKHESNVTHTSIARMPLHEVAEIQITPAFFDDLRVCREFKEILRALDIAHEEQLDLFETLDVDGSGTLDLEELIQGIAKLRGDARRSDVVSVSLMVRALLDSQSDFERYTQQQLARQSEALDALQASLRGPVRSPRVKGFYPQPTKSAGSSFAALLEDGPQDPKQQQPLAEDRFRPPPSRPSTSPGSSSASLALALPTVCVTRSVSFSSAGGLSMV